MHPLLTWFVVYVIPALAAWVGTLFLRNRPGAARYNAVVIHIALLVSVLMSQYMIHVRGLAFPWHIDIVSVLALLAGTCLAFLFLGPIGIWYAVSALIQDAVVFSVVLLLLHAYPLYLIILLIIPFFVLGHFISLEQWRLRSILLVIWGIVSILLFVLTWNLYVIASLHAILGSMLMSKLGKRFGIVQSWLR